MKPIPLRTQLILVAAGYVAVLAMAGALVLVRYMQYVHHPDDAAAAARDVGGRRSCARKQQRIFFFFRRRLPA